MHIHNLNSSFVDFNDTWGDVNDSLYFYKSAFTSGLETSCTLDPLLSETVEPILPLSDITSDYRQSNDECSSESSESWSYKSIKSWEKIDTLQWINNEARNLGVCCTELAGEKFATIDGIKLIELNEADFMNLDPQYGKYLHRRLKELFVQDQLQFSQLTTPNTHASETMNCHKQTAVANIELSNYRADENKSHKESTSCFGSNKEVKKETDKPGKGKPGRPRSINRKKKPEKLGRLWEFIRDLLKNKDYCPSLIVWDNYEEGTFRFVNSDRVAKLWGKKKDNPEMNYEKLSRAMRYYYKSEVLKPVLGRRLVYKFGPRATGWQVDNPNFRE